MREILEIVKEFWLFFVGAVGALLTLLKGYSTWKREKKQSIKMLFQELESLKLQWIEQVKKEIVYFEEIQELKEKAIKEKAKYTKELLSLNQVLEDIRRNCSDCYDRINKKNRDT